MKPQKTQSVYYGYSDCVALKQHGGTQMYATHDDSSICYGIVCICILYICRCKTIDYIVAYLYIYLNTHIYILICS